MSISSFVDLPLVYVETSLVDRLADRIAPLLSADREWHPHTPSHAIFYAIVSTQPAAVAGLELGRTLIYQAAQALTGTVPRESLLLDEAAARRLQRTFGSAVVDSVEVTSTLSPRPI